MYVYNIPGISCAQRYRLVPVPHTPQAEPVTLVTLHPKHVYMQLQPR
ncbi:MAG TPA: hypothetical protein VGM01_05625 [Ktedonobacteraceae bacterium]